MTWHLTATQPLGFGVGEFLIDVTTDGAGHWVASSNHISVWVTNNDGSTWTGAIVVDAVDLGGLSGVRWLHDRFVAWGPSLTSGSNIYTSPDGITWTQRASQINIALGGEGNEFNNTIAAYGLGTYVIGGSDIGGGSSVTSPDGVTWTLQNVYTSGTAGFFGIIFDGTQFVAVTQDTGLAPPNQVLFSTDGANWTFQPLNSVPGPGPFSFPFSVYHFVGKYLVNTGWDQSANGGLGQGWYEVATILSPWNGSTVNVNTTPIGGEPYAFFADNGTIALGTILNANGGISPAVITTTDGATFAFEDAGFNGGEIGAIARGTDGFMAVGNDSSNTNIAAFRPDVSPTPVPNVFGLTQNDAENAITAAGFTVGTVTQNYNPAVARTIVYGQTPAAGTLEDPGFPVNIVVSLGPRLVTVPDVIGLTLAAAQTAITNAGLTNGAFEFVRDITTPAGEITLSLPPGGSIVAFGSSVALEVSASVPPFDVDATVISQYANSPTLIQLVENMNDYLDPTINLLEFYSFVWNVDTAVGFGLDIWGRIVGVSRVVPIPGTLGFFGFNNADSPPDFGNFGNSGAPGSGAPFFSGQVATGSYTLADDAYRTLILAKALANISATTAPALNQLISNLFPGSGRAFTIDRGNSNSSAGGMAMTYVFEFPLSTIDYAILAFSGVLPHPAGVKVNVQVTPDIFFGFKEGNGLPFGQGIFFN